MSTIGRSRFEEKGLILGRRHPFGGSIAAALHLDGISWFNPGRVLFRDFRERGPRTTNN
jgi:hypothetical protein